MAASDPQPHSDQNPTQEPAYLPAAALAARLDEEIHRAERQGTPLSCLLLVIENLEEIEREHGSELPEQTLSYVGGALRRELRAFDRIGRPSERELLIVLPGADGPRGEIVARRMLERLRTIKVEAQGSRRALRVSMGLASWQQEASSADLLTRTRATAPNGNGDNALRQVRSAGPFTRWQPPRWETPATDDHPTAAARFTRS